MTSLLMTFINILASLRYGNRDMLSGHTGGEICHFKLLNYRYLTIMWWERTQFSNSTFWRLVFSHEWFRIHLQRDEVELGDEFWTYNSPCVYHLLLIHQNKCISDIMDIDCVGMGYNRSPFDIHYIWSVNIPYMWCMLHIHDHHTWNHTWD